MTPKTPEPKDNCPRWAADMIARLEGLEIQLGNIAPASDWQETKLKELYSRSGDEADDSEYAEGVVETLFRQISRGLTDEGFAPAQIANFINARVASGRLPYCDANEVREALQ